MSKKDKPEVIQTRPAGDEHQVVSLQGGARDHYRRKPCGGCPWVVENTGDFPAEAFAHSAETSYDMSQHSFACHEAGSERPKTCAGFLLRGADHNLTVRMRASDGSIDMEQVHEDGRELHESYRAMAVANGLDPDDPSLERCRP